jgi:hypothetical protein
MPFGNEKEDIHTYGTNNCSCNDIYITDDPACWMASYCTDKHSFLALQRHVPCLLVARPSCWMHVPFGSTCLACWQPGRLVGRACHLAARALLAGSQALLLAAHAIRQHVPCFRLPCYLDAILTASTCQCAACTCFDAEQLCHQPAEQLWALFALFALPFCLLFVQLLRTNKGMQARRRPYGYRACAAYAAGRAQWRPANLLVRFSATKGLLIRWHT